MSSSQQKGLLFPPRTNTCYIVGSEAPLAPLNAMATEMYSVHFGMSILDWHQSLVVTHNLVIGDQYGDISTRKTRLPTSHKRLPTSQNGYQRYKTVTNVSKRLPALQNGYQHLKTVISVSKWLSTSQHGCQRLRTSLNWCSLGRMPDRVIFVEK